MAARPSSPMTSGNPSLVMLIGVWADSSASIKDAWLSEDACLAGESSVGVPARLRGREKLNDGRGNGAERSELIDGDLWK